MLQGKSPMRLRNYDIIIPSILNRYFIFGCCVLGLLVFLARLAITGDGWLLVALFAALVVVGIHDLVQTRHALLRNYPVIGHVRYLVEEVRPELRQYLFEHDSEALPFSRVQRSLVYQRAKSVPDQRPFGTLLDGLWPGL